MEQNLRKALAPEFLEIIDDSDKHKGHQGARDGGETHFSVTIVSAKFSGLNRLERHRLVNSILKAELEERIHALSIKALIPEEKNF